jgi:hypothetical protein
MRGWEPGSRQFDQAMSADPLHFVGDQLSDLKSLMDAAGVDPGDTVDQDADELQAAVPEILQTVQDLLVQVREGHRAKAPDASEAAEVVRTGWL